MKNLKIKVNSEAESREVQELFFELGYKKGACSTGFYPAVIIATPFSNFTSDPFSSRAIEINREAYKDFKEITLAELRDMVASQHSGDEPFLTPECTLNDQYAEIEQVRQAIKVKSGSDSDHALDAMSFGLMGVGAARATKDNVNHPSHYTQGKVECIDALESATIGKSGIEAVCVANIVKYLWRYEEKNGVEDVKKAKFYLNRLLATLENNNG